MGRVIDDHRGRVNYVEFNSDGTQILTASDDCSARTWHPHGIRSTRIRGTRPESKRPSSTPTARVSRPPRSMAWRSSGTQERANNSTPSRPATSSTAPEFSPDGKTFVTAGLDGRRGSGRSTSGDHPILLFRDIRLHQFRAVRPSRRPRRHPIGRRHRKGLEVKDGSLVASLEGPRRRGPSSEATS